MKNIVIVGAGFGGLTAAIAMKKSFGKTAQISVIDKENYHLLSAGLYEAACSDEEVVSLGQLKEALALPLYSVLGKKGITFIQAEIKNIDPKNHKLQLAGKQIFYDYLILASGSQNNYFNVPGAKEHGLTLKTLPDAMRIRARIEAAFQAHTLDFTKKPLRVIVAGGGYTGCELAAELSNLKNFLCWKYNYPHSKVEILIVEAGNRLISSHNIRLSRDAEARLKSLGVNFMLSTLIQAVSQQFVESSAGEKLNYDVLIWTAGIKSAGNFLLPEAAADQNGRLYVNENLQLKNHSNIFALGDTALVLSGGPAPYNLKQSYAGPAPSTAQMAISQAKYLAKNLPKIIQNKPVPKYKSPRHGFVVTLGGKWAILDWGKLYFSGFLPYLIHHLAYVVYLRRIIGFWPAVKKVFFQSVIFARND